MPAAMPDPLTAMPTARLPVSQAIVADADVVVAGSTTGAVLRSGCQAFVPNDEMSSGSAEPSGPNR